MWEPPEVAERNPLLLQFIRAKETLLLLEDQDEPQTKVPDLKPFGLVGVRTNGKGNGIPTENMCELNFPRLEAE